MSDENVPVLGNAPLPVVVMLMSAGIVYAACIAVTYWTGISV